MVRNPINISFDQWLANDLQQSLNYLKIRKYDKCTCSDCLEYYLSIQLADTLQNADAVAEKLLERVWNKQSTYWDNDLFYFVSTNLLDALKKGFINSNLADISYQYGLTDQVAQTMMEINLYHFSAAKTLTQVAQLNDASRKSKSFDEFKKTATGITDVNNKNHLRTEYDTAYSTAQNASAYYRMKSKTDVYPYWQYRTAADSKVRDQHRRLNGTVLPHNDEAWKSIYPPNGWNCRCRVVPMTRGAVEGTDFIAQKSKVAEFKTSPEYASMKAQGFATNKAELKQVFEGNQMYIRKFPDKASAYLNKLDAGQWNAGSFQNKINEAIATINPYEGERSTWFNRRVGANYISNADIIGLKDYNGRTITMSRKTFDIHTTNAVKSREYRSKYLNDIETILQQPDEIWINNGISKNEFNQYVLVKYFKNEAVAVVVRLSGNMLMEVATWFPISVPKDVRRGLLIKK